MDAPGAAPTRCWTTRAPAPGEGALTIIIGSIIGGTAKPARTFIMVVPLNAATVMMLLV
jgi:hypothetical protein